jgi:trimethylamine--corrinoid protein Co-methyltransferase
VNALWAAMLAQATVTVHAAGWLEGGLSFGYEKFILDIEALQTLAELTRPAPADAAALAYEAIADVAPGGHFFATAHTMERYQTAFYAPLVADLSNHGLWMEQGAQTADQRATVLWQRVLADFKTPKPCEGMRETLAPYIAKRLEAGGMPPED